MTHGRALAMALLSAVSVGACGDEMNGSMVNTAEPMLDQITSRQWERLAEERIFFGHQSVGENLMAGVQEILAERPEIRLRVIETAEPSEMQGPGFYHAPVGRNGEPASKLTAFDGVVNSSIGESGTALLKYCYVDVDLNTDPNVLFEDYRRSMASLKARHPRLTVMHLTLPLQADAGTLRHVAAVVRGLPTGRQLNLIRYRYNELVRQTYGGKEPIFDLARFESIRPDGGMALVRHGRSRVPVLASAWTYDGGHLNEAGRRELAAAFLATLAGIYGAGTSAP